MKFAVYERRSRPTVADPIMAIQKHGTISFNAAAFELVRSSRPDDEETWGQLLYSEDEKAVAVRAVKPGSANSYPIRKQQQAESYIMTGKGFMSYNRIPIGQVRHYNVQDFGDGVFGFRLGKDEFMKDEDQREVEAEE